MKRQFYAGIMEIVKDTKYYYHSSVGGKYSHFTEQGEQELLAYVQHWAPRMVEHDQQELDARAKEMVIGALKQ